MNSTSPALYRLLSWITLLVVPVALVLSAVRIVLNPWFLQFEYRTPGFPADPYGFTQADRLRYSRIDLDYLLNNADISFLGNLHFPEGQQAPAFSCQFMDDCTKLYNDRELKHMVDVKIVVKAALKVWYGSLGILLVLGVWSWRGGWWAFFRQSLRRGGWLTLILIGIIIFLVLVAFGVFFVFFHEVFFAAGTWVFYTSDTLIRLFPERFWRDTFTIVGLLAGGFGLVLAFISRDKK